MTEADIERRCAYCGNAMERRPTEGPDAFSRRKYWSFKCSVKGYRSDKGLCQPQPHCEACGKVLTKRDDENLSRYRVRRFCGPACKSAAQVKANRKYATVEAWLAAGNKPTQCPTMYVAPVVSQAIGGRLLGDGKVIGR